MAGATRLASDVRTNEITLAATIIQNSNTTVGAVVVSDRGPREGFYDTYDSYVADYGPANSRISYDGYSLYDFFREGNSAWIKRALTTSTGSDAAKYGALGVGIADTSVTIPLKTVAVPTSYIDPLTASFAVGSTVFPLLDYGAAGTPLYVFYSKKGPSSLSANVSIRIESMNLEQPAGVDNQNFLSGGFLNSGGGTTFRYRVAALNAEGQVYLARSRTATLGATTAGRVRLNWTPVPGAVGYVIYGRSNAGTNYTLAVVGQATLTWTDDGTAVEDTTGTLFPSVVNVPVTANYDLLPVNPKFVLKVFDSNVSTVNPVETFTCSVTDQTDEMGQQMETKQRLDMYSEYLLCVSNVPAQLNPERLRLYSTTNYVDLVSSAYVSVPLGAGQSGAAPTASEINATWTEFEDKEKYVLDVLINAGRAVPSIQKTMDQTARNRADCVAFLDTPSLNQKVDAVLDYRRITLNLNSTYSALFCSDLLEDDLATGKLLYVPPSGAMAGLLARTTRVDKAYRSMAGLNRGLVNALDVRETYRDGEATQLATAQVNYMRKFLGAGIPLWEQWTLSSAANALQFLNVRVLCNVLKRSMYGYLLYSLQEPNDETLRKAITYDLSKYLEYVQGTRGISSFKVVCNRSNNPDTLVNTGTLKVSVLIVPILAVRAIELSLIVGKEGLQITEQEIAALSL